MLGIEFFKFTALQWHCSVPAVYKNHEGLSPHEIPQPTGTRTPSRATTHSGKMWDHWEIEPLTAPGSHAASACGAIHRGHAYWDLHLKLCSMARRRYCRMCVLLARLAAQMCARRGPGARRRVLPRQLLPRTVGLEVRVNVRHQLQHAAPAARGQTGRARRFSPHAGRYGSTARLRAWLPAAAGSGARRAAALRVCLSCWSCTCRGRSGVIGSDTSLPRQGCGGRAMAPSRARTPAAGRRAATHPGGALP